MIASNIAKKKHAWDARQSMGDFFNSKKYIII
jgi:hypothetical protein